MRPAAAHPPPPPPPLIIRRLIIRLSLHSRWGGSHDKLTGGKTRDHFDQSFLASADFAQRRARSTGRLRRPLNCQWDGRPASRVRPAGSFAATAKSAAGAGCCHPCRLGRTRPRLSYTPRSQSTPARSQSTDTLVGIAGVSKPCKPHGCHRKSCANPGRKNGRRPRAGNGSPCWPLARAQRLGTKIQREPRRRAERRRRTEGRNRDPGRYSRTNCPPRGAHRNTAPAWRRNHSGRST